MRFRQGAKIGLATILATSVVAHHPHAQEALSHGDSAHHQAAGVRDKGAINKKAVVASRQQEVAAPVASVRSNGNHGKPRHGGKQQQHHEAPANVSYRNEKGFKKTPRNRNRGHSSWEHDESQTAGEPVMTAGTAPVNGQPVLPDETPYVSRTEFLQGRKRRAELHDRSINKARKGKQAVRDFYDQSEAHDTSLLDREVTGSAAAAAVVTKAVDPNVNIKDGRVIGEITGLPPEWSAGSEAQVHQAAASAEQTAATGSRLAFLSKIGSQARTSFATAKPMMKLAKGLGVVLGGGLIIKGGKDFIAPTPAAQADGEEQGGSWQKRLLGAGEIAAGVAGGYVALTHGGKGKLPSL